MKLSNRFIFFLICACFGNRWEQVTSSSLTATKVVLAGKIDWKSAADIKFKPVFDLGNE